MSSLIGMYLAMSIGLTSALPSPILDQPAITSVLFHPRKDRYRPDSLHLLVEDGVRLGGRLHKAAPDAPLILFFHGNGETVADYDDLGPYYTGMNISFLVFDYRGYGESGGTPSASTMFKDGHFINKQLTTILKEHNLAPKQIIVMGRSLGSALAIELAVNGEIKPHGLILESPFANTWALVNQLGGRVPPNIQDDPGFGNVEKMTQLTMPVLLIHGKMDKIIPYSESERLKLVAKSKKKELLLIPGAGHNNLLAEDPKNYFQTIARFVLGVGK